MPPNSDGIYQQSDHSLTVTFRTLPGDERRTQVCLAGEIDMASCTVLTEAVDWLTAQAPLSVLVDLAELTFACSTLANFVIRVRQVLPEGAELILQRAGPATNQVLQATDIATIATIRAESFADHI